LQGLLQLIGLYYSVRFVVNKGVKAETRSRVAQQLQGTWNDIVGDTEQTKPASSTATTSKTSQPTAAMDLSDGITPSELIKAAQPVYDPNQDQRKMFAGVTGTVQILIPLTGVVDVDALRAKLEKDLAKSEGEVRSFTGRLSNKGFTDKAPADVVQGARDALAEAEKQVKLIQERLAML
jgi:valyl-tRNA synthetase